MMFNFGRLQNMLSRHQSTEQRTQDTLEFWKRVSRVAMLCWADNTQEAIEKGVNSVGFKEIDALLESVWYMRTMEETCDDDEEIENYHAPFGENIFIRELICLLINVKPLPTPTKIF